MCGSKRARAIKLIRSEPPAFARGRKVCLGVCAKLAGRRAGHFQPGPLRNGSPEAHV